MGRAESGLGITAWRRLGKTERRAEAGQCARMPPRGAGRGVTAKAVIIRRG